MLEVGTKAPDFTYRDLEGNPHRLSDLRGKKGAIVYFYPKDFTPGCTKEACSFRDAYPTLADRDTEVIGISPQDDDSHDKFRERHGLPFPLVADTDKAIANAYDVVGLLGMTKRVTFVVDKDGIIRDVIHAELRIGKHLAGVQAILDQLR